MPTDKVARYLNQYSDAVLTGALVLGGVIIIALALSPTSKWTKAVALAYIALP